MNKLIFIFAAFLILCGYKGICQLSESQSTFHQEEHKELCSEALWAYAQLYKTDSVQSLALIQKLKKNNCFDDFEENFRKLIYTKNHIGIFVSFLLYPELLPVIDSQISIVFRIYCWYLSNTLPNTVGEDLALMNDISQNLSKNRSSIILQAYYRAAIFACNLTLRKDFTFEFKEFSNKFFWWSFTRHFGSWSLQNKRISLFYQSKSRDDIDYFEIQRENRVISLLSDKGNIFDVEICTLE